jgi:hypothetical protein
MFKYDAYFMDLVLELVTVDFCFRVFLNLHSSTNNCSAICTGTQIFRPTLNGSKARGPEFSSMSVLLPFHSSKKFNIYIASNFFWTTELSMVSPALNICVVCISFHWNKLFYLKRPMGDLLSLSLSLFFFFFF